MTDTNETPIFRAADARQKAITLQWPLSFQGREYDVIVIKRMTVQRLADFIDSVKAKPENEAVLFPVYFDREGNPVPAQVLANLDPDDDEAVQEAALDFLPRRFRAQPVASGTESAPSPGGATAPSSSA